MQHHPSEPAEFEDPHDPRSYNASYSHPWNHDEQNQSDNDNLRHLNVPSPQAHMSHTPQSPPDMHRSPSPYSPQMRYQMEEPDHYYNQQPHSNHHNPQDPYDDRRMLENPPDDVDTEDEQQPEPHKQHRHREEEVEEEAEQDGAVTQSESDEPDREPSDGGVTEEESNPSPPPAPPLPKPHEQSSFSRRKSRNQVIPKPKRFSWSDYHSVVYRASEYCKQHNSPPSVLAYARILGAGKGTVDYYVRSRSIFIGRWGYGSDCQIKSDSRSVSRKHAKLYWDSALDNWMLVCLSAKNGMIVDGAPIAPYSTPVPLKSKTLVEMGDAAFYFLTATEIKLCVNDLHILDQLITEARTAEENDLRYAAINGNHQEDEDEVRPEIKPSSRNHHSSRKGVESRKAREPIRKGSKPPTPIEQEGPSSDSSMSEDEQQAVPDILDDPKYRLISADSKRRGGEKGRKKRRKRDRTYDHSNYEALNYTEEWNKKEKTDFTRALFAVGIDAVYDDDGNISGFDWTRFRNIVDFPKKSDEMLEEHYRRLMGDVHYLLDGTERKKKAKNSKNKHGDDNESSKSGKRKRNDDDDDLDSDDDGDEKGRERLIGLVTAQKLRVRIGILEAAKRVDEKIWDFAMNKLESTLQSSLKEFPDWWQRGPHDRDLMRGVARHGICNWSQIWEDETLDSFVSEIESHRMHNMKMIWPSNQAVMKRVREIGNAMIVEMKRLAKREADEERRQRKRARKKDKRLKKMGGNHHQHRDDHGRADSDDRREDSRSSPSYHGDERQQQGSMYAQPDTYENGESTADDSESENRNEPTPAEEVETEDEEEVIDEGREPDENVDMRDDSGYQRHGDVDMRHNMVHDQRHHYDGDRYGEPERQDTQDWRYSEEELDRGYATASESE